jgi:hypothetical protein
LAIRLHGPFAYLNRPNEVQTTGDQKSEARERTRPTEGK